MCRVLSHELRVVRLYRTFSIYIVTGETRCAYALVRAAKVRILVFFEMVGCRARALPSLHGYALVGHFDSAQSSKIHESPTWGTVKTHI